MTDKWEKFDAALSERPILVSLLNEPIEPVEPPLSALERARRRWGMEPGSDVCFGLNEEARVSSADG